VGVILLWVWVFPRESQNPILVALLTQIDRSHIPESDLGGFVFSPCWARNSLLGPIPCWARPAGLLPACSCCCRASCCGAGGAVWHRVVARRRRC
jgi:hypothetical protein